MNAGVDYLIYLQVIGQLQKEIRELNNHIQEELDFWEWYEEKYGMIRKELWQEYESGAINQAEGREGS